MTHIPSVSIYNIFGLGPKWLGCTHAEDVPFVFGHAFIDGVQFYKPKLPRDEEIMLSVKLMKYWTNFAKHGYVFSISFEAAEHPITSSMNISVDIWSGTRDHQI